MSRDRVGEGADHLLLLVVRHARIAEDDRLAAAMGQARGGILPGHGARQSEALFRADVGRHPHAADRRSAGDVVDDHDRLERRGGKNRRSGN